MPDESDETRRFSPGDGSGEPSGAENTADATQVGGPPVDPDALDATQVGGPPVDPTVGRAPVPAPGDDDTLPGLGSRDDDTLDDVRRVPTVSDEPTVVSGGPGSTAVMPPVGDDDWAPSRGNPAWSGRAEVRAPQPGRGYPEVDWAASAPSPQRDRWWMPIVVGIIALILLAVLGWAVYLLVNDSDEDRTPVPPPVSSAAAPTETATTETASPSPSPTTTSPSPSPSPSPTPTTSEPTSGEVTIPALRGLALPEAQAALRSTGLAYRLIYRQAPEVPAGTVIDSDPVEGQEVPPDTTVTLVVAAEPTATPTTTGPTQDPDADQN
ncbi:Stk1 family PASTA domain-containing Ser/Thr kinase [Actinoplanes sp. M2I2]|uniref:Stk1 family PASTA domain-containing Ser/Thr kinase n=1 Tax=Actinoplanes sp. M2I2 TaxID=1734444 RepID=UPI002021C095|nr:Stk1 family PASTA domain-containing Ser/Thr kinase [Actinoplanes sp. M2I2]